MIPFQVPDEATKLKSLARVISIGLSSEADPTTLQILATFPGNTIIASNPSDLLPLADLIADATAVLSANDGAYRGTSTYKSYCMKGTLCFVNPRGGVLYAIGNIIESSNGLPGPAGKLNKKALSGDYTEDLGDKVNVLF